MPKQTDLSYSFDVASAVSKGARDYQEDALLADVSNGAELSFVIVADGMGGHAAGDLASKIVVTEVFRALTFMRAEMVQSRACVQETLRDAACAANDRLRAHVDMNPDCNGMGATLVAAVLIEGALHWISIGDSPLFLFRDNALQQLNADHSMSTTIDTMVKTGVMSEAEGHNHPDRNVLTSVLYGKPIPEIDCPTEPTQLLGGDTLIVASDGLQFLSNAEIEAALRAQPLSGSAEIAESLMTRLTALNDPDLDNVSLSVLQVKTTQALPADAWGAQARAASPVAPSFLRKMFAGAGSVEACHDG